ncbi:MAG: allophanate hydrolase, partial [Pseudomonadota bacterium]|nr:allophanate hydrolase [Pseudomonadota bacterium]
LEGPAIEYAGKGLVSEGLNIGSVQVPPNGQPIIMMNDRQTLGGYPKLGNISPLDLSRLAQCRPGQTVQFTRVEVAQVQQQLTKYYDFFGITPACQTDH